MSLARRHAAINRRLAAWRLGIFTIIFNNPSRL
jgi:hypothetical protein